MAMSIYLHFPFCVSKCFYCDFTSFSCKDDVKASYVNRLVEEIKEKSIKYNERVKTIYFGGGTPTSLDISLIERVLNCLKSSFDVEENAEITIEGNPATFDKEYLTALSNMGFNRFSVGVQSFNDVELLAVNRIHTKAEAISACKSIGEVFSNYSLDIMMGLPNQTLATLESSLVTAVSLNPTHISTYMLKVEKGTPLEKMVESGKVAVADEDTLADYYDFTVEFLKNKGFKQYETSNFAKDGFHSRHNMSYWDLSNYLGIGISAHSLYGKRRFYNTSSLDEYLSGNNCELLEENLSDSDLMSEYVMLGFRLNKGIDLVEFQSRFNKKFTTLYSKQIEAMKNYLHITPTAVAIKPQFFSVSSSIIAEFI